MIAAPQVEPPSWTVFPVEAKTPPPRDPTLLRLSSALSEQINASVKGEVKMAKPEVRDEHCAYRGIECPPEIAGMLGVNFAVALYLADDYSALAVHVFKAPAGRVRKGKVACAWKKGIVACDEKALAGIMKSVPLPEAFAATAIQETFESIDFGVCKGRKKKDVQAHVRVRPDGQVRDVRLSPRSKKKAARYACMAKKLKETAFPPFQGKRPQSLSFSLD